MRLRFCCHSRFRAHGGSRWRGYGISDFKQFRNNLLTAFKSTSILSSLFLALVKNPQVLKRAHEEIDRVVGSERLPTIDDRPNLPYVEAILAEVARIRPPVSLRMSLLSPYVSTSADHVPSAQTRRRR